MRALKGKETKTDTKKTAKEWLKESQTDMNIEVVLHLVGGRASTDVHLKWNNKVYGICRLSV